MFRRLKQMLTMSPPATSGQIVCDGQPVYYSIVRSRRRTMSIVIKRCDCSVSVRVPEGTSDDVLRDFVESKREWIATHRRKIMNDNSHRVMRRYEEGATHLYLGRHYVLRLVISPAEGVELKDNEMIVSLRSVDRCERVLYGWYAARAAEDVLGMARPLIHLFAERTGRQPSAIKFVRVKSYWGQCSTNGLIKFNIELIRAHRECIEYIIIHELCHLVHHNHSPKFHNLVASYIPDWKQRKELLDATVSCRY